ncbi:homeobox protein siamois-like [Bufo gargarizans]|uniref:homeobox protein siamois-like n=1 Tax=Bufo gargarizans TaxID=30331 RepID=UPI001CF52FBF|nr:homeobox protein siamois-like [Bufo gargarizans]
MDVELDQVLCTVLSLEEDYPALSPPLRSQDHLSSHSFTSGKNPDDGQNGCKKPRLETMPSGAKSRKKTIYSNEQIKFLQNQFKCNPYPDFLSRCHISQITGIPEPRILVWFQNRRARYLSRRNQIPEKKKSTAQILPDFHKRLPSISMENIWMY